MHPMSASVMTWGELCALADAAPGKTHTDEPIEKLLSAGMVITGDKDIPDMDCGAPGPGMSGCCGGGCAMG